MCVCRTHRSKQTAAKRKTLSLFFSALFLSPSLSLSLGPCHRHDREAPEPVSAELLRKTESEEQKTKKRAQRKIKKTRSMLSHEPMHRAATLSQPPLSFKKKKKNSTSRLSSATASSASPSRTRPRSPTSSVPSTRPREFPPKTPRSPSTRPCSLLTLRLRPRPRLRRPSPRSTRPPPPRPRWPLWASPTAPCSTSTTPSSATSPPSPGPRRRPSGPR